MTEVSQTRKKKYKRRKEAKYGNINKGFTESELKRFLSVCKNKKARLAFSLMAYLGLRIGEAIRIKIDDIDFHHQKLRVSTEKARSGDLLYLHNKVRILLLEWVRMHPDEIMKNNGYVLFSEKPPRQHISEGLLRKEFRDCCKTADLVQWYSKADDTRNRKLYRLTTHSLRHYFITKVYKQSKDPVHTKRLARHRSFKATQTYKTTQTYIRSEQHDIDKTLQSVFGEEGIKNPDLQEFMEFYKTWKKMKS